MKQKIVIFDNHKIPRKYRKYVKSFYIQAKDQIWKDYEFASSGEIAKRWKIPITILGFPHANVYDYHFELFLKESEFTLLPFKSVQVVNT